MNKGKPEDFNFISVIGKGSYGKVMLVSRKEDDNQLYAMKILKKKYIEKKKQEANVIIERDILASVEHQFIVKLFQSFQDEKKLYFVLEYCQGGEFFGLLAKLGRLTQQQAKFYSAQIIEALYYLHQRNILYRDLKPENVLVDNQGYLKLTDFGLSKQNVEQSNAMTMSGTPEYLAPQILGRRGHGKPVDWWCLGSMIYEMVIGLPPFYCQNRSQLFEKIKHANPFFPDFVSPEFKSFIELLLRKDPENRLGTKGGGKQVKSHAWFNGFSWENLMARKIQPPYIPLINSKNDVSNFDPDFTKCEVESRPSISSDCTKSYFKFSYENESCGQKKRSTMDIEEDGEFYLDTFDYENTNEMID